MEGFFSILVGLAKGACKNEWRQFAMQNKIIG